MPLLPQFFRHSVIRGTAVGRSGVEKEEKGRYILELALEALSLLFFIFHPVLLQGPSETFLLSSNPVVSLAHSLLF